MDNHDKKKRSFLSKMTSEAQFNVHHGSKEEALKCYDKILKKYPKEIKALYGKGMIHYQFNELKQALAYFEKVLTLNSEDVDALYGKGSILSRMGHFEEALVFFEKVIAIDPKMGIALMAKGYLLLDLNNAEGALDCFLQAEKMGRELDVLNGKGHALRQLEKPNEAKKCFDLAIKINAYDAEALFGLGMLAFDMSKLKEAQDYLHKSVVQDEENLPAWLTLADIFKKTNQPDKEKITRDKIAELESL
ncbi:MAG: tetratricopeptide repeat protein [Candidatus Heimdallarchaeota archaeon]